MENKKQIEQENACAYWLYQLSGIGKSTQYHLLSAFGSARAVFEGNERELCKTVNEKQLQTILHGREDWDVEKQYELLQKEGVSFYGRNHPGYPGRLRDIPDAPAGLFVKGRLPQPDQVSVAIIGARMCSEYGRYTARQFGCQLAQAGIQIISGMARGIDGISQKAALEAGGVSFGVLGCGVDICYPRENRELYEQLQTKGGVISEYLPGVQPQPGFFPPRNRIISGLADAVLVIEAKEKSGTLITVDMALEQGREVYALPGRVTDSLSRGCNHLIRQGAGITLSPQDLREELERILSVNWRLDEDAYEEAEEKTEDYLDRLLEKKEKEVYIKLDWHPQTIEQLKKELPEFTLPELMQLLMQLCLKQLASQINGQFVRTR